MNNTKGKQKSAIAKNDWYLLRTGSEEKMNNTIRSNTLNARNIAIIGLLGAVTAVLGMTPLGFIPIGPTRATILHIPVIIGAILYGPMVGGFVGLIFGGFSFFNAITNPTPVSFVFLNPIVSIFPRIMIGMGSYYAYEGVKKLGAKNFKWILFALVSGISAYLLYGIYNNIIEKNWINIGINIILLVLTIGIIYLAKKKYNFESLEIMMAAIIGTMINTLGVLSLIYFLYGERFVAAIGQNIETTRKIIFGIGIVNGIPESILATILVTSVVNAVMRKYK